MYNPQLPATRDRSAKYIFGVFRHSNVAEVQGFKNILVSEETWVVCIGFIKTALGITFSKHIMFEIILKAISSIYPWPTL